VCSFPSMFCASCLYFFICSKFASRDKLSNITIAAKNSPFMRIKIASPSFLRRLRPFLVNRV